MKGELDIILFFFLLNTIHLKSFHLVSFLRSSKKPWNQFFDFIHGILSKGKGKYDGQLLFMASCELAGISLHNGQILAGDWYLFATGDEQNVTFFATDATHGYYVAQLGPMPVKSDSISVDALKAELDRLKGFAQG